MNTEQLKRDCGQMLQTQGLTVKSKAGKRMVHAFWIGVWASHTNPPAFIFVHLATGRHEDLVVMPTDEVAK